MKKLFILLSLLIFTHSVLGDMIGGYSGVWDPAFNEKNQREIDWFLAPIKRHEDMQVISMIDSPLDALSKNSRELFIESMVYEEGWIGFKYTPNFQNGLTLTQIHSILSLIGQQYLIGIFDQSDIETSLDAVLLASQRHKINVPGFPIFAGHPHE